MGRCLRLNVASPCVCVRVFTLHAGQFTLTRIWHAIEESGAGSAWTRHRWAKQLKTLFTGWCVTLCSVSSRVPKYSQNPPRKSKRDYFSIKSGVTLVLCSSLAFTATPARAQCISRAVHECYKKNNLFFFFSEGSVHSLWAVFIYFLGWIWLLPWMPWHGFIRRSKLLFSHEISAVQFCREQFCPLSPSRTTYIGCYFTRVASAQYIIGKNVSIINDCLQLVS